MENQEVTKAELEKIRGLEDFDLIMLISDIHDCGWKVARRTLKVMPTGKPRTKDTVDGHDPRESR